MAPEAFKAFCRAFVASGVGSIPTLPRQKLMNKEPGHPFDPEETGGGSIAGQPAVLIMNPVSGRGLAKSSEPKVLEALKNAGIEFSLLHSEGPGHLTELARKAASEGMKLVIVGGGDGTVHEAAAGLWDSDVVLGVIPLGSGNDFAGSQGIPMNLDRAVDALRQGNVFLTDVGRFGERYFFNTLGVGFGPTVTINARKYRHIRGYPLYLVTVVESLFRYRSMPLVLEAPDYHRDKLTYMLVVGIGTREGGGFKMTPDAVLDDGKFDLCIVDDLSIPKALSVLPQATKGTHVNLPIVEMVRVSSVTVTAQEPIVLHADGEIYETGSDRLELTCLQRSLRVVSPPR